MLCSVLCCVLLRLMQFGSASDYRGSGHEAHEVHRAEVDVVVSHEAEEEGEIAAT